MNADVLGRSELASLVARSAIAQRTSICAAESLTGGMIASALAEAPGASTWFEGAFVAYSRRAKHELLGFPEGPVVTAAAAKTMASAARTILGARIALGVTGSGGPDSQDSQPPGTVYYALATSETVAAEGHHFREAGPREVCERATEQALRILLAELTGR